RTLARGGDVRLGRAQHVVLADAIHLALRVIADAHDDREVGPAHLLPALVGLVRRIGYGVAGDLDQDGHQARPLRLREREAAGADRELAGLRRAVEPGDRGRLERLQRLGLDGPDRVVALPALDVHAGAVDLDVDRPVAPVVVVVGRGVAEEIVEAHVLLHAREGRGRVVRVADEETAGLVREPAEPALRVQA